MQVLLVEDDAVDEKEVRRMMPRETEIHCVRRLSEAIERLQTQQFNLILLDLGLPDSSGLETFTQLRSASPEVPIVVLTGLDDDSLAVLAIREGAQDFLVKGYMDTRSLRSLGFAVERAKLLRQLSDEQQRRTDLERSLREQERQLLHFGRVALMGEIVADIAHEVSQPLQAVASLIGVLEIQQKEESSQEVLARINESLKAAQQILQRTRNFIRKSEGDRHRFEINDLVSDSFRFVEHELQVLQTEVEFDLDERPLSVVAERLQIQQVLLNLFRNAADALKDQEQGKRFLRIRSHFVDDAVVVEVIDSGKGLPTDLESVFAPYTTTKENGLGMGLAIASRIMQQHDGTISARTENAETVFSFSLPGSVK